MAESTVTIQNILDSVPRSLRRFAEPAKPLEFANEVSKRLDKECNPRWTKKEAGLILVDGQTDYVISEITDDIIKDVIGLFPIKPGYVLPDKNTPIRDSEIFDGRLRLDTPYNISDESEDFENTLGAASGSSTQFIIDTVSSELIDANKNYVGYLCRITYNATGKSVDRVIRKHEVANGKIYFNGNLAIAPDENDTYRIVSEFFICEYTRYFPQYTALLDTLGVDELFEPLYRKGMVFLYHQQSDKSSSESREWERAYEEEIRRFVAFESKMLPELDNFRPRKIPRLF